jgi:hypothetical protein
LNSLSGIVLLSLLKILFAFQLRYFRIGIFIGLMIIYLLWSLGPFFGLLLGWCWSATLKQSLLNHLLKVVFGCRCFHGIFFSPALYCLRRSDRKLFKINCRQRIRLFHYLFWSEGSTSRSNRPIIICGNDLFQWSPRRVLHELEIIWLQNTQLVTDRCSLGKGDSTVIHVLFDWVRRTFESFWV